MRCQLLNARCGDCVKPGAVRFRGKWTTPPARIPSSLISRFVELMILSKRACFLGSGLVLLVITITGAGCSGSAAGSGGGGRGGRGRGDGGGAVPVVTTKVTERDVPVDLAAIGNVEAYTTISVRSQVTGV